MDAVQTNPQIRVEKVTAPITLDRVYHSGEFQKPGTKTAQIRQIVTTKSFYPSKKTSSDLQANIFDNKEFGFEEQEFTSVENRMAWLLVPADMAEEAIKARVAAIANTGHIYRVLSNKPILDENQKYAIAQGLRTMDDFAKTQVSRYPADDAAGRGGQLILDKAGNVQYRRTFFWKSKIADQDFRGKGEVYVSPEILAEMHGASVLSGQEL